jgi:hypothetical protein
MSTIESILDGGLNSVSNHLASVEAKFFEVVKVQLHPNIEGFKSPENFGVYKSNGGEALSVMGKDFTPMQPREFYDNIVRTIHECGANLDLETLKFREFNGGRKIEFSVKMFPISFKNNKGLKDITNLELTFSTSYDGSKSNLITLYTERLVCLNGMVAKGIEGILKGRNTIGGKAKILSYCDEVAHIINGADKFRERMIELDKRVITRKELEVLKFKLLGFNAESLKVVGDAKPETKKINILDKINESIELEFSRTGVTAFGFLQGVTHYTNHVANGSKSVSNAEYIRFYQGAKLNNLAQDLVFALV